MTTTIEHKFQAFEKAYEEACDWDSVHSLWSISAETNGPALAVHVSDFDEPYEMVDAFVDLGIEGRAMVVMYGWAAPYKPGEDDTRPSQHEARIRVRLYIFLDHGTVYTAMRMRGGELDTDMSDAGGPLDEAIKEAINRKKNK